MRRAIAGTGAVLIAALAVVARAEPPLPPAPTRFVTDRAGLLSPPAATQLEAKLEAYARGTGHQVIVYVDRTTGGIPIEDWAVRAFQAWGVGRRGLDDGVALFLFTEDRRGRIEVGYGLEERLPDAVAARLIRDVIAPRLRAGDGDGAVRAGVEGITAAIGGSPAGEQGAQQPAPLPRWALVLGALGLVFLLGFAATHPAFAASLLYMISSGRGSGFRGGGWGGGGFGGGGGFSGGGGRSGGGGASGSW